MRNEPRWLPLEEIVEVNRDLVALTGEPFFVRDRGLLESACAKPRNRWGYGEDDIVALAVALLFGIARNHPFGQGNKRTGFTAAVMFLRINGYDLTAADSQELGKSVEDIINNIVSEERFTEMLRPFVVPI
ncbi:MAG TPA: type II toxin-antitoxin system death-on-curing family toxin [Microvirga sp.]|nr:type II toxin-antitoxin system death-on-curing family toxin [Microvirga sp.]